MLGNNSLKISAACIPPEDGKYASTSAVAFGVCDDGRGRRKVGFTSKHVEPLETGVVYNGMF